MVGGSLWVLRLYTTKTGRHDIAEILLKVALNTKNKNKNNQIAANRWFTHVTYPCHDMAEKLLI
jgi:hypothetical protein